MARQTRTRATHNTRRPHPHASFTPAFTGRYFAMSLRKPFRTRRGGGRVVRGRDACVALAGGGKRAQEQDEGDASVPTPRPHHSRPYECDDLPPKSRPLKDPPPPLRENGSSSPLPCPR